MVVEGAVAARSAYELAGRLGVDAPIVAAVHAVLYDHAPLQGEMRRLLDRMPYDEFYGLEGDAR